MKILVSCGPGERRVAAWDGTALVDYTIEREATRDGVGDIHRARILKRMPALAGSFVALDGAEGFLPDSAGGDRPEGATLAVRIVRAAQGGKGPRLAAAREPFEPGPPALLRRGPGAVERLATLHPDAEIAVDDAAIFAELRPTLAPRLVRTARAFDDMIEDDVAALAAPIVDLPGGARMQITPTPALTAIDLDLGALSGGRAGKRIAHEDANRAAIPALARQIRLRNLGGAIVIDLAGLSPKRRAALGPALQSALADDPLAPRFLGFSALGLAEILRPRIHPPLHEWLGTPHATGLAALRELAWSAAHQPERALALAAPAGIIAALREDAAAQADILRLTGRPLVLMEADTCRITPI